jgi:hypothetical protein
MKRCATGSCAARCSVLKRTRMVTFADRRRDPVRGDPASDPLPQGTRCWASGESLFSPAPLPWCATARSPSARSGTTRTRRPADHSCRNGHGRRRRGV